MHSKANVSLLDSMAPRLTRRSYASLLWQALSFGVAAVLLLWMFHTVNYHLAQRGVQSGFSFLAQIARVPISHSPVEFVPGVSTYARVLVAGALNSIRLTMVCIVASTIVGFVVGTGSLATNWLLAKLCIVYVEALRNVPVLLQIFVWYQLLNALPSARSALEPAPHVLVSNRGLYLPTVETSLSTMSMLLILSVMLGAIVALLLALRLRSTPRSAVRTAQAAVSTLVAVGAAICLVSSSAFSFPELNGFDFTGGTTVSPEFLAVTLGLTFYTAAFVAEIVRGGIRSVPKGQWEAAHAIGLSPWVALRKVIFPQALRPAVPALTNEYLGVLKNSSLAVAVGYQELVSLGNTVAFETGQAVSVIFITMAFYLLISLAMSFLMNQYHAHVMKGK